MEFTNVTRTKDTEMEEIMTYPVVKIKKGEGRQFKAGGLWIYDNEIDVIEEGTENGQFVKVVDFDDYPLGVGFINTNSKIIRSTLYSVRLLYNLYEKWTPTIT